MGQTYFEFKQFTVHHERCAMKVGTDGVLLGAWAELNNAKRILDIGCGTGLLSLMAAQRNQEAEIVGIDLLTEAVEQAEENARQTNWYNRLSFLRTDVADYTPSAPFDVILCNPPFFFSSLKSPDAARTTARHADTLPPDTLTLFASRWLEAEGHLQIVIPIDETDNFVWPAWQAGLQLVRRCKIQTKEGKPAKRVLLDFCKGGTPYTQESSLILMDKQGQRTEEYAALTRDFYLY